MRNFWHALKTAFFWFITIEWMVTPRCCFYEDGEHRCVRSSKYYVPRAGGFQSDYCERHVNMRLA